MNVTRWKVAICGEYMKSRFKVEQAHQFSSFYLSQSHTLLAFVDFHYAFLKKINKNKNNNSTEMFWIM